MDERLRFVARRLEGESMTSLCEEFGISRKTGYKIFTRYQQVGVRGLTDRSRRPNRHANQLPVVIEKAIVGLKREYPAWGAPKIQERLRKRWPELHCPAISTVHAHARPSRPGASTVAPPTPAADGDDALATGRAESFVVCGLQRRVSPHQSTLLLSADHHGLREPVPARVRGAVDDPRALRVHRI